MEFITTVKGGLKLVKDNFLYHITKHLQTLVLAGSATKDAAESDVKPKATTNNVIAQYGAGAPENVFAKKEDGNDAP